MLILGGVTPGKMNGNGTPKSYGGAWTDPMEKYARQNGFIFPKDPGANKQYLKPPPSKVMEVWWFKSDLPFSIFGVFLASKSFISPGCIAWGFENLHQHSRYWDFCWWSFLGLKQKYIKGVTSQITSLKKVHLFFETKKTLWNSSNPQGPCGFGFCFICRDVVRISNWTAELWTDGTHEISKTGKMSMMRSNPNTGWVLYHLGSLAEKTLENQWIMKIHKGSLH